MGTNFVGLSATGGGDDGGRGGILNLGATLSPAALSRGLRGQDDAGTTTSFDETGDFDADRGGGCTSSSGGGGGPVRQTDTYGHWMASQCGCSPTSPHLEVFALLRSRAFDRLAQAIDCSPGGGVDGPRDDFGNTLFLAACHGGSKRAIRWCLAQGADVNASNRFGNTGGKPP